MRATSLVLIGVSQIHVVLNILINRNYSYCNTMYKWINKRFCLSVCLSLATLHDDDYECGKKIQQVKDGEVRMLVDPTKWSSLTASCHR